MKAGSSKDSAARFLALRSGSAMPAKPARRYILDVSEATMAELISCVEERIEDRFDPDHITVIALRMLKEARPCGG